MIFFNEKKIEKDSDNFWHRKLTLKVRNCHFWSLDLERRLINQKKMFYEKVIFSTELSYIWCGSCWKILKCYVLNTYLNIISTHCVQLLRVSKVASKLGYVTCQHVKLYYAQMQLGHKSSNTNVTWVISFQIAITNTSNFHFVCQIIGRDSLE